MDDNLASEGRPAGTYVTEYVYRDPYYDGVQREFRGFAATTVRAIGDQNSPTSASRTEFLLGRNPSTDPADRWRDNPHEALKGLPSVAETYDPATGGYLSTTGTTYTLRKLYDGQDGRGTYVAFAKQTDTWLYDTASFASNEQAGDTAVTSDTLAGDELHGPTVTVRAQTGTAHTRSAVQVDPFGNKTHETAYGVVGVDEVITTRTEPDLVPTLSHVLGEGNWAWRTVQSWVVGSEDGLLRNLSRTTFDGRGDPTMQEVHVSGSQPLAWGGDPPAGETLPSLSLVDGWQVASKTQYDTYGNSVFTWAAGARCSSVQYDDDFTQLPMREAVYVGASEPNSEFGELCGNRELAALASYDRGLQAATEVFDINGGLTRVDLDTLVEWKHCGHRIRIRREPACCHH